ncbi:Uncharacterized protein PECH_001166 [Penicillium ucsense]|uniref:Uncharacterized protein n=1 Tax=Penicillium ucsense TaxID=2839758 RepID=A0A8J8WMG6_9EURO|nr:Uncharacterized protein PECM_000039 [Penicillium ucsense]KAF7733116.1 Uncharacterized protein PECH_001166 [Penicillium ucsense]
MSQTDWTTSLSAIGLATLSLIAFKVTRQVSVYCLPSSLPRYNQSGTNWALVTGATDGIGFGFCEELCSRGFSVILHGRNQEKLNRRVQELQAAFPERKTGVVVFDVVDVVNQEVDRIAAQVRDIIGAQGKLSLLVNNVGGEMRPAVMLRELSSSDVDATINMNARFTAQITRLLLPFLEEGHEEGPSGFILNVSSFSSFGLPYLSIYSATKGFVTTFTRALEAECRAEGRGVEVMGLLVGEVRSGSYKVEETLFIPKARTLAQAALNRIGCGRVMVAPYFWHWLQSVSFEIFPRWMLMKFSVEKMKSIRATVEKSQKSK